MATTLSLPTIVPVPIPPEKLYQTVEDAKDLACINALLMRTADEPRSSDVVCHAPFMLLPSPIPKALFQKAVQIQPYINELYFKVANDYDFLQKTLQSTIAVDDFLAKQWKILDTAREHGKSKSIQLAMIRSDYMIDTVRTDFLALSQVEVNTIAAGAAGHAPCVENVHRFVIGQLSKDSEKTMLPPNHACHCFAEALYSAWKEYGDPQAVVIMLVEEAERYIFDQRLLEGALLQIDPTFKVRRRTMSYIGKHGTLTDDRAFVLDGEEVAIFYFRTGYDPNQFTSDFDWKAKLNVELSKAVVCPCIRWHLAGSKKVQQELARPGVLEKFISDPDKVAAIRDTFTGLYSLDMNPQGDEMASRAIANPDKFVLKPQLEGGGNNIYGDGIKIMLQKILGTEERSKYILMDRIIPPSAKNYSINKGFPSATPSDYTSEFGFFGYSISSCSLKNMVVNKAAGHMVRTKPQSQNEVGIMLGEGNLGSPFLLE